MAHILISIAAFLWVTCVTVWAVVASAACARWRRVAREAAAGEQKAHMMLRRGLSHFAETDVQARECLVSLERSTKLVN